MKIQKLVNDFKLLIADVEGFTHVALNIIDMGYNTPVKQNYYS